MLLGNVRFGTLFTVHGQTHPASVYMKAAAVGAMEDCSKYGFEIAAVITGSEAGILWRFMDTQEVTPVADDIVVKARDVKDCVIYTPAL